MNDLGPAGFKHVQGHRYAFQRPNAKAEDWPAICSLLQALETTPCISLEKVSLAVGEGITGSQHFTQCIYVTVFYFQGDDGPEA